MKHSKKRWIGMLLAACLVMSLLPGAALAAENTYGGFTVTGDDLTGVSYVNNVLTISSAGTYTIKNTDSTNSTQDRIAVDVAATITLNGVNIETAFNAGAALLVNAENAKIILANGSVNSLTSNSSDYAGLQNDTNSIEIACASAGTSGHDCSSCGSLTATGKGNGAGIGGGSNCDGSNITISGGTVTASSTNGAGIGGGNGNGNGSDITISGGIVTASSTNGFGIGGRTPDSSSNIKIIPSSGKQISAWNAADSNGAALSGSPFRAESNITDAVKGQKAFHSEEADITYGVTSNLTNLTYSGSGSATHGVDYAATLTAASGYALPGTITVTVGGTALTAGTGYTYDSATGALTINGASVTGNIVITAEAVPTITINTQPQNATVTAGSISGSLSVAATVSPSGTPTYQWYKCDDANKTNAQAVSGATGASFAIPTTLTEGTYYYFCRVSAAGAVNVDSNVATVTVESGGTGGGGGDTDNPPVITSPTKDQSVIAYVGDTATLSITATGATTYQWEIDRGDGNGWVPISGASAASYTTSTLALENDGYRYRCVAYSGVGANPLSATSPVFTLRVLEKGAIPPTGDDSALGLWLGLALFSLAGMAAVGFAGRRRQREN